MTRLMTVLLERVAGLPDDRQDEVAQLLSNVLDHVDMVGHLDLTPEQKAEVLLALSEDDDNATDAEVDALFASVR